MAGAVERRRWDLLIILTSPPHTTDSLTTVLRLAQAVLDEGRSVRIWACGYNTMLTQASLGAEKPVNLRDPHGSYPSAAGIIQRMVTDHAGKLSWIVCTACSAERGATGHIREVRLRSEARLAATLAAAERTIYVGGA